MRKRKLFEADENDIILDSIKELTTTYDEEGNKLPSYFNIEEITSNYGLTEEEVVDLCEANGYNVYRVSLGDDVIDATIIADASLKYEDIARDIKTGVDINELGEETDDSFSMEEDYMGIDDVKPFTQRQVFDELKRETYNFTKEDTFRYSFESEWYFAIKILEKHYEDVEWWSDWDRFGIDHTVYFVSFKTPIKGKKKAVKESVLDDIKFSSYKYLLDIYDYDDNFIERKLCRSRAEADNIVDNMSDLNDIKIYPNEVVELKNNKIFVGTYWKVIRKLKKDESIDVKHGDVKSAPFVVSCDGEKFAFDTKHNMDAFIERNKHSFDKIEVVRSLEESLEKDYSDIPLVDRVDYKNPRPRNNPMFSGIFDLKNFVKALDSVGKDLFKVRTTKFGSNVCDADLKDDRSDIKKAGWSIDKAWDSSLSGFNEVYICKKINNESIEEKIEKQEDVEYKGITIEHFPLEWHYADKTWDQDGYVIKSPYYLQSNEEKEKTYLPLYCENEYGEVLNFKTLDDAKKYIDEWIISKKGTIKVKHGDEIHFEILPEYRKEKELEESKEDEVVEETKEYKIVKTVSKTYRTKNGVVVGKPIVTPIYQVYFRTQDFNPSVNRWMNKDWSLRLTDFKTLEDARAFVKKYGKALKSELEEDLEKADSFSDAVQISYKYVKERLQARDKDAIPTPTKVAEDMIANYEDYKDESSSDKVFVNKVKDFLDKLNLEYEDEVWINEDIEKHDELNQKLFDGNELKPEVKDAVKKIVDSFVDNLKEDGINMKVKDIILIGSNVSYNYTKDSDLDVHIIADSSALECPKELVDKLYGAYRAIFNKNYDITIKGIPTEIFVELDKSGGKSNGIYSINTGWIKEPVQQDIPDLDEEAFEKLFTEWEDRYFDLIGNQEIEEPNFVDTDVNIEEKLTLDEGLYDEIDEFITDIYKLRQESIATDGEYGLGNLVFKEFRNLGYLDNLRELKRQEKSKELSLESINNTTNEELYNNVEVKNMKRNKKETLEEASQRKDFDMFEYAINHADAFPEIKNFIGDSNE